MVVCACSHAVQ